ncbi:hypothetical protein J1N35_045462 [Gossypium stocksii]|uniref:Copper transport protein n=1 Tax=Gossypium stocksii TaxID=47602 RepID=A0A9D3UBD0_9ROSI|nr:hypothetical protein J1N35_045462 [Gossypium stocksii]
MMHMTFYWSRQVTLLFTSWRTDSWPSVAGSRPTEGTAEEPFLLRPKGAGMVGKIAGGVLFGLSSALGYLLMLAVMSFNGGVFLAVILGLTVGYLVFRGEDDDQTAGLNSTCACA